MTEPKGSILVIELDEDDTDADPGSAPAQMIDVLTDGNAIRTGRGMCSPGFDRDNPPWRRPLTSF